MVKKQRGTIFQIQHFSVNDGEGIRTTIFLSGCPLRCKWCCNPESWELKPGQYGRVVTLGDIEKEIDRQLIFYRHSGGGITYSGGEPAFQHEFLRAMVNNFYDMALHQAIETCGYFDWDAVVDIFEKLDFIFIDIKHMDNEKHEYYTGCSNRIILENIVSIGRLKKEIVVRIPLIMGINDDKENISKTAEFIARHVPRGKIEILPYHSLGNYKYDNLGLQGFKNIYSAPDNDEVGEVKSIIKGYGVEIVEYK